MSSRDTGDGRPERDPPSLLDRMRSLFGGGNASIRDDIEEALDGAGPGRGVLAPGAHDAAQRAQPARDPG